MLVGIVHLPPIKYALLYIIHATARAAKAEKGPRIRGSGLLGNKGKEVSRGSIQTINKKRQVVVTQTGHWGVSQT